MHFVVPAFNVIGLIGKKKDFGDTVGVTLSPIEKMIKKIVLDFYVYNLFKIDSDKKIGTKENKLVNTIKEFNSEHDLLDYFLDNQDLKYVLRDYYIFYNISV